MSYNYDLGQLEAWIGPLDLIAEGKPVGFQSENPKKLAFKLRQALAVARHFDVEPYAALRVEVKQYHDRVEVVPRVSSSEELISSVLQVNKNYPEARTEFDVIATASRALEERMCFPFFSGDIDPIKTWADAKGYVISDLQPLTLEKSYD